MTSLALAHGTWDDARALIGPPLLEMRGADQVDRSAIRRLLEVHEWDYPVAYDTAAAEDAGLPDIVAPATSYLTFALPAYWSPGDPPLESYVIPPLPYRSVPGEGSMMIATAVQIEFAAPLHPGDRVTSTWWLRSVVPKTTRVGAGAFLTFEALFANQRGDEIARERTTVLRYGPDRSATPSPARSLHCASGGLPVTPTTVGLSLQRLVMAAGANRDLAPVHHDPEVAADAGLGQPFANSMFMATQFERTACAWAGPAWSIERMSLQLLAPAAAGSTLVVSGTADTNPQSDGGRTTLWLEAHTGTGIVSVAEISGSVRRTPPRARSRS
ncbi:MAG: MaoC family dehydratase N-terminal domain-containing protein [Acidimicrobiia bacterium]